MLVKVMLAELPPVPEGFEEKLPDQEEGSQGVAVGTLSEELRRLYAFLMTEKRNFQLKVLGEYLTSADATGISRTSAQKLAMTLQEIKTLEMIFATKIRQLFLDQAGFDQELLINKDWVVTRKPMDPEGGPSLLFQELGFDVYGRMIIRREESQPTEPSTD